jgi:hypothetical protein
MVAIVAPVSRSARQLSFESFSFIVHLPSVGCESGIRSVTVPEAGRLTAARALADAGFPEGAGLNRKNTGVVVGNSLTGEFGTISLGPSDSVAGHANYFISVTA